MVGGCFRKPFFHIRVGIYGKFNGRLRVADLHNLACGSHAFADNQLQLSVLRLARKRRTDMYALHKCKINTLYFIGHLALQNQVKYIGTERLEIVDYRKYVNGEDTYVLN